MTQHSGQASRVLLAIPSERHAGMRVHSPFGRYAAAKLRREERRASTHSSGLRAPDALRTALVVCMASSMTPIH